MHYYNLSLNFMVKSKNKNPITPKGGAFCHKTDDKNIIFL